MNNFLFKIEDPEKVELFRSLARLLGVDMWELQEEEVMKMDISISNGHHQEVNLYYEVKDAYTSEDLEAIITQFPIDKKWTFSDLQDETIFPPDLKVKKQLIDNKLYIMANPTTLHQKIVNKTSMYVTLFVEENKLGDVYIAPTAVKIDENNTLEPDIIFISLKRLEGITMKAIESVPELVVEVISPSNYKKLREEKKAKYAQFGIEEYWEIYPKKQLVRVETLVEIEGTLEKEYQLFSEVAVTGKIESKVLAGFELEVEKIFG